MVHVLPRGGASVRRELQVCSSIQTNGKELCLKTMSPVLRDSFKQKDIWDIAQSTWSHGSFATSEPARYSENFLLDYHFFDSSGDLPSTFRLVSIIFPARTDSIAID